jgi:hypothetical protein
MDATLVTARSDKEGAAPTWKKGYDHPLGAWCASTRECLAMLLRPGNAGSNCLALTRRDRETLPATKPALTWDDLVGATGFEPVTPRL